MTAIIKLKTEIGDCKLVIWEGESTWFQRIIDVRCWEDHPWDFIDKVVVHGDFGGEEVEKLEIVADKSEN